MSREKLIVFRYFAKNNTYRISRDLYSIYQAEADHHFPQLTVAQTLNMAVKARITQTQDFRFDRNSYARNVRRATTTALDLFKTLDTRIGSDVKLGANGGERKRLSIAEILVGHTSLQCWDNNTKGLDSTNALTFIKTIRALTNIKGSAAIVSLYQVSQDMYNTFDKHNKVVLYTKVGKYFLAMFAQLSLISPLLGSFVPIGLRLQIFLPR